MTRIAARAGEALSRASRFDAALDGRWWALPPYAVLWALANAAYTVSWWTRSR